MVTQKQKQSLESKLDSFKNHHGLGILYGDIYTDGDDWDFTRGITFIRDDSWESKLFKILSPTDRIAFKASNAGEKSLKKLVNKPFLKTMQSGGSVAFVFTHKTKEYGVDTYAVMLLAEFDNAELVRLMDEVGSGYGIVNNFILQNKIVPNMLENSSKYLKRPKKFEYPLTQVDPDIVFVGTKKAQKKVHDKILNV